VASVLRMIPSAPQHIDEDETSETQH
jgi:hypothetical protein